MAHQARLANNRYHELAHMQGAPRQGPALLVGLSVCGSCGRQMYVRYKPAVRYECRARQDSHALPACQHVDGTSLEATVTEAFFAALRPAELDLLDEGLAVLRAEQAQRTRQQADQVRRADYEARLAQRRYQAIDPDNRLVAAELERQWERALRALAEAREAAARAEPAPAPATLDPVLRQQVRDFGAQLPVLWESGRLRPEQQKALPQSLIRRVVVTRPEPARVEVGIVWVSGAVTRLTFEPTVGANMHLREYPRLVERIRALSAAGYHDRDIARHLLTEDYPSARHTSFPLRLVRDIRKAEGLPSF